MKFKIDENLPIEISDLVRAAGHDAHTVSDEGLAGSTDPEILAHVRSEGRALLTLDKGIADIRVYPPHQFAGIILFRPSSNGRNELLALVRLYLPSLLQIDLNGRLVVVSDKGIRTR